MQQRGKEKSSSSRLRRGKGRRRSSWFELRSGGAAARRGKGEAAVGREEAEVAAV